MNVAKYTFQSPYSSPVQVGRLDPSSTKETGSSSANMDFLTSTNQAQPEAKSVQTSSKSEVTPSVNESRLLDTCA